MAKGVFSKRCGCGAVMAANRAGQCDACTSHLRAMLNSKHASVADQRAFAATKVTKTSEKTSNGFAGNYELQFDHNPFGTEDLVWEAQAYDKCVDAWHKGLRKFFMTCSAMSNARAFKKTLIIEREKDKIDDTRVSWAQREVQIHLNRVARGVMNRQNDVCLPDSVVHSAFTVFLTGELFAGKLDIK